MEREPLTIPTTPEPDDDEELRAMLEELVRSVIHTAPPPHPVARPITA